MGISQSEGLPTAFALHQNYPNPFNPVTTIAYDIPRQAHVVLAVYDVLGRKVAELVNETLPAGSYSVQFDGSGLSSGVYVYRLESEKFSQARSLVLIK